MCRSDSYWGKFDDYIRQCTTNIFFKTKNNNLVVHSHNRYNDFTDNNDTYIVKRRVTSTDAGFLL